MYIFLQLKFNDCFIKTYSSLNEELKQHITYLTSNILVFHFIIGKKVQL